MNYKICVYAICKNEEREVFDWIESMSEADYICVLDTGSTDNTYTYLKQCQEKYPNKIILDQYEIKPWRFDVARNESMKLIPSDTDICICTDLDERLIEGWANDVRELWTKDTTRMGYKYAWSHNSDGSPARVFWYDKIHSYGEWAWKFQVHESLYYFGQRPEQIVALKDEKIYLHHYPDMTKTHRSSYLPLLEARAIEYPDDWYGLIYLAHEYYYQNKDQECINFILSTVMPKLQWHNDDMLCATDLYLFLGKASQRMENYDSAEVFYTLGIKSAPTYRENYLHLAEMFFNLKHYEKCIETINTCLIKTQRYYSWLEEDDSWSFKPYDLLSLAYYYMGQKEVSLQFAKIALSYSTSNKRLQNNVTLIEQSLGINDAEKHIQERQEAFRKMHGINC